MKTLVIALGVLAIILGSGYAVYKHGYKNGSQEIRLQWEQDKAADRAAHDELVAFMAQREADHRKAQESIADEAALVRKQHEGALATQRAVYEQRLLQSSRRGEVYRREAEAGSVARLDLAGHAARLDLALEEGRGLVEELRTTLGLRDHQLKLLGEQIRNDRRLME